MSRLHDPHDPSSIVCYTIYVFEIKITEMQAENNTHILGLCVAIAHKLRPLMDYSGHRSYILRNMCILAIQFDLILHSCPLSWHLVFIINYITNGLFRRQFRKPHLRSKIHTSSFFVLLSMWPNGRDAFVYSGSVMEAL